VTAYKTRSTRYQSFHYVSCLKVKAMSPLNVDLAKNSFFTFFEKKVKPKNFKYYSICLFNKQLLYKIEVFSKFYFLTNQHLTLA